MRPYPAPTRPPIPPGPALTCSEADWQSTVMDLARTFGWRVSHQRPAQVRPGRWASAVTGDVGVPDLILARDGIVYLAELKRHRATPTPEQRAWLAAAGGCGRLWSPHDWPEVYATLRGGAA